MPSGGYPTSRSGPSSLTAGMRKHPTVGDPPILSRWNKSSPFSGFFPEAQLIFSSLQIPDLASHHLFSLFLWLPNKC